MYLSTYSANDIYHNNKLIQFSSIINIFPYFPRDIRIHIFEYIFERECPIKIIKNIDEKVPYRLLLQLFAANRQSIIFRGRNFTYIKMLTLSSQNYEKLVNHATPDNYLIFRDNDISNLISAFPELYSDPSIVVERNHSLLNCCRLLFCCVYMTDLYRNDRWLRVYSFMNFF